MRHNGTIVRVNSSFAAVLLMISGAGAAPLQKSVDFSRDILPILADTCFTCHGPDQEQRVSELRLDVRDSALADHDGIRAIVPGKPEASELVRRITSRDKDDRMPPPDARRQLSSAQAQLLEDWVQQGAVWGEHWAFQPPRRPPVPDVTGSDWPRNPIDSFVLQPLQQAGLQPSPQADKRTLIRRVTLDLTGLPPTPEEVTAFLADSSPAAFSNAVDRLLSSPAWGEHMAAAWLDAARYADTSGYQNDGPRQMWRWRDWVIDAFNQNMPFDQFTVEQIAGDLLENPSLSQRIATGFNRNHRGNAEGGIIPEEYQVEYVVDRVDTTFTVWMGLTMGCARCHDHKYDPLRQKEYYQVFAWFNNIPESGRAIKEGNSPPWIKAPTPPQEHELAQLDAGIRSLSDQLSARQPELTGLLQAYEQSRSVPEPADWTITDDLVCHLPFDRSLGNSVTGSPGSGAATAHRFEAGRTGEAIHLDGSSVADAGDTAGFGYFDRFTISAWIRPARGNGTVVSRMTPVEEGSGYSVHLQDGRLLVNLVKRWLDDAIRLESREALPLDEWQHITVAYDGSRLASGISVYRNGQPLDMQVLLDRINQTFSVAEPLRIGGGHSPYAGLIDELRIYRRDLPPEEAAILSVPESVAQILRLSPEQRSPFQQLKLVRWFLHRQAPDDLRQLHGRLAELQKQRRTLDESIPTVMVMEEMPTPRETHILIRGQYDRPGDKVTPGVPAVFPGLPPGAPNNRLGFARWLVMPEHPLTARVAVNRFWQRFFGMGLVRTAEDFGVQGERPSHPELLDWLAVEFVHSGWNVRALQKLIVSSATYQQESRVTPELLARDPENRLLGRGPRHRLSAEVIRDQALLISGLLKQQVGGPSVKPWQPDGLWTEIATDTEYVPSSGSDRYRRSLYTYWKRTVAPPTMVTLDAVSREACTVQRSRTNTPLQALALMNDTAFVEAARAFANRLLAERITDDDRIILALETATARRPQSAELQILRSSLLRYRAAWNQAPRSAAQFLGHTDSAAESLTADVTERAAWTTLASLVLNLDEVITKE